MAKTHSITDAKFQRGERHRERAIARAVHSQDDKKLKAMGYAAQYPDEVLELVKAIQSRQGAA